MEWVAWDNFMFVKRLTVYYLGNGQAQAFIFFDNDFFCDPQKN